MSKIAQTCRTTPAARASRSRPSVSSSVSAEARAELGVRALDEREVVLQLVEHARASVSSSVACGRLVVVVIERSPPAPAARAEVRSCSRTAPRCARTSSSLRSAQSEAAANSSSCAQVVDVRQRAHDRRVVQHEAQRRLPERRPRPVGQEVELLDLLQAVRQPGLAGGAGGGRSAAKRVLVL